MSPTFRACTYLALLSGLVSKASGQSQVQQFDPLNDYCRRFAHQTTVIDNRLYIDGGLVNYGSQISSETVNYTNTFLLYLDLDTQANNFLVENASLPKPSSVPSVQGGILWPDTVNKRFYLFGGEYHGTIAPPSQFSLWEFDVFWNRWSGGVVQSASGNISSVSFGAGTVVDDRGWGYYYGGWQNNATTLGWHGDASAQPGLIKYDMIGNTWSNITFIDSTPRAEGAMFYIPASDQGMLVYVGGVQQNSNFSYVGVPLNVIHLYDIASGYSYTQNTSGTAPGMRRRFCGGVNWPQDQSSYNIYLYGGLPPYNEQGSGFGDVWILSIPSFTWTQWYPSSGGVHSSSCNVVDQSQLIVVGGSFPNSSNINCDAKGIWGQHNLNLGVNDGNASEWYHDLPNITTYQVPSAIVGVVGGGTTGGATLTTPASGWSNADLGLHFKRSYSTSRTATRSLGTELSKPSAPAPIPSNVGAVAGGVVGGVIGLAAIVVLVLYCLRRRKLKQRAPSLSQPQQVSPPSDHKVELPNGQMTELPSDQKEDLAGGHRMELPNSQMTELSSGSRTMELPNSQMTELPNSQMTELPDSQMTELPATINSRTPSHKRDPSGQSIDSPTVQGDHWTQLHAPQPRPYHPPPPQAQQYYPPPPAPQQSHRPPSPIAEMPNVRSPVGL